MRRPVSDVSEVVAGRDDASAEMVLPDAVHHDTRGELVFVAGDPVSQCRAASAGLA